MQAAIPALTCVVAAIMTGASSFCVFAQEQRAEEQRALEAAPALASARPQCFSPTQGRAAMAGRQLVDPFQCMRETAHRMQAEALNTRVCRLGESLLYEISLLHRDGRVQRVFVDATNGRPHPGRMEK